MQTIKSVIKELLKWVFIAPLYAAGIALSLVLILTVPLAIDLAFDPKHASEGMRHLFDTLYIWLGLGVVAGGYGFLLAVAPATFTGITKVFIDRVVGNPKHRERWIYGFAVPVSTVAWFYYLMMFPSDFRVTGSVWGRPVYSWMTAFIGVGLVCCWLMFRYRSKK